jgi:hypothetical protein
MREGVSAVAYATYIPFYDFEATLTLKNFILFMQVRTDIRLQAARAATYDFSAVCVWERAERGGRVREDVRKDGCAESAL